MTRFVTADEHFHHLNIIKYTWRPFSSVDEMDRALTGMWDTVDSTDEVYVLGDLALGAFDEALELLRSLPGRNFLVPGQP
jgi:calcineurin-like phosphoesterase family protein